MSWLVSQTCAEEFPMDSICIRINTTKISRLVDYYPREAFARDYVITGVGLSVCLSVCLFVCYHDN